MSTEPKFIFEKGLGDCYEITAESILDPTVKMHGVDANGDEVEVDLILVHGVCSLQGRRWGHAWIELERNGEAVEHGAGRGAVLELARGQTKMLPREAYYRGLGIEPGTCHRYTRGQARRMLLKFRHYGPWAGEFAHPPK